VKVHVFGPNLSRAGEQLGTFHVHAAECGDCRHYGPGRKYGGERTLTMDVASAEEIVRRIYPEDEFEGSTDSFLGDFHFAPCVKELP
jgi:hypothetical protein